MKTLIIDNYDSFTFNLVELMAAVVGRRPQVIKNDAMTVDAILALDYDNVVISPGPGHPAQRRAMGICLPLLARNQKPLLGVCLGHQLLGYYYGQRQQGVVVPRAPLHGKAVKIWHADTGILRGLPQPFLAARYHSLVVDEQKLPMSLEKTAWDEQGMMMAHQHRTKPIWGVQFHPESILTPDGKKIIENFYSESEAALMTSVDAGAGGVRSRHHYVSMTALKKDDSVDEATVSAAGGHGYGDSRQRNAIIRPQPPKKLYWRLLSGGEDGREGLEGSEGSEGLGVVPLDRIFARIFAPQQAKTSTGGDKQGDGHDGPHRYGAACWLDGDESNGWGGNGFSYMGMASTGRAVLAESFAAFKQSTTRTKTTTPQDKTARGSEKNNKIENSDAEDFFHDLRQCQAEMVVARPHDLPPDLAGSDFLGGLMGFMGYEARTLCDAAWRGTPSSRRQGSTMPPAYFIAADRLLVVVKKTGRRYLLALVDNDDDDDEHGQAVSGRALADDWFERATAMIAQLANDGAAGVDTASSSIPPLKLTFTTPRAGYLARIKKIIALIKAGEVYQICLTNEMVGTIVGVDGAPVPLASLPSLAPITTTATHVVGQRGMKATTTKKKKEYILPSFLQLYRALAAHNNTSYRALMVWRRPEDGLAGDDRVMAGAVCCFSPENFLRVDAGGCITTQPIKGTMGRGKGKVEDERLKNTLQASAKNQAENIMIVDLLRNDLSRVATMGSVRVPHINRLETYDHVHQLVSTITADLAAGHDLVDLLGSAFPGGSMTGAPKIRAMELLDQLEARQRGIYAGMIGFIGGDGACQLAMVIRTLLVERRPYRPSMSLPMSLPMSLSMSRPMIRDGKAGGRAKIRRGDQQGQYQDTYRLAVGGGIVLDSNPTAEWQELQWKAKGIIKGLASIMTVKT